MGDQEEKARPKRGRLKRRITVERPKRDIPTLLLRSGGLLLFAILVGSIWFRNFASWRTGDAAEPIFEIVTAPADQPLEIAYGPSTLVIDSGTQVVLPRVGRLVDREITLQRGRVSVRVRRLQAGEAFAVRTAQAVAGVRGTAFTVAIQDLSRTIVSVDEGSVEVEGLVGAPVIIGPGQTVVVEPAKPPVVEGQAISATVSSLELPPVQAPVPVQEPRLPDHTTRAGTSDPTRDEMIRTGSIAAGQSEMDEKTRIELLRQNATTNNPAPQNPAPQSPQPRSLR